MANKTEWQELRCFNCKHLFFKFATERYKEQPAANKFSVEIKCRYCKEMNYHIQVA